MLKKYIKFSVIFITLFSLIEKYYAYEFIENSNEDSVNSLIRDVYDAKEMYEDLAGEYEEITMYLASSNSYWWPIASQETVESDGKIYASGEAKSPFSKIGSECFLFLRPLESFLDTI